MFLCVHCTSKRTIGVLPVKDQVANYVPVCTRPSFFLLKASNLTLREVDRELFVNLLLEVEAVSSHLDVEVSFLLFSSAVLQTWFC